MEVLIALLVLGPKRLPDAGRSLGRGIKEFKGAITGGSSTEPTVDADHRIQEAQLAIN